MGQESTIGRRFQSAVAWLFHLQLVDADGPAFSPNTSTNPDEAQRRADMRSVTSWALLALITAWIATIGYCWGTQGGGASGLILWGLGLGVAGGFLGFLFGIPKVLQSKAAAHPAAATPPPSSPSPPTGSPVAIAPASGVYEQRVNTNLEEISDWLTKILVGLGLTQLAKIRELLRGLAANVAKVFCHPDCDQTGVAYAVIVFYGVGGFLFGYLITRLWIQGAFARADRTVNDVDTQLIDQSADVREDVLSEAARLSEIRAQECRTAGVSFANADADALAKVIEIAKTYNSKIGNQDEQSLRQKDDLAAQMAGYLVAGIVSRDKIVAEIRKQGPAQEGLIVALAAAIHALPRDGDADVLLNVVGDGTSIKGKHAQYRIAMALGKLAKQQQLGLQRGTAAKVLHAFWPTADPAMRHRIERSLRLLDDPELSK